MDVDKEAKKKKAVDIIKKGGYVDDVTDALDITVHEYYSWRHEDEEFDEAATRALASRTTQHGKDTDEKLFLCGADNEGEVERRSSILQLLRQCSIK